MTVSHVLEYIFGFICVCRLYEWKYSATFFTLYARFQVTHYYYYYCTNWITTTAVSTLLFQLKSLFSQINNWKFFCIFLVRPLSGRNKRIIYNFPVVFVVVVVVVVIIRTIKMKLQFRWLSNKNQQLKILKITFSIHNLYIFEQIFFLFFSFLFNCQNKYR